VRDGKRVGAVGRERDEGAVASGRVGRSKSTRVHGEVRAGGRDNI
jgi:hypothetical protein